MSLLCTIEELRRLRIVYNATGGCISTRMIFAVRIRSAEYRIIVRTPYSYLSTTRSTGYIKCMYCTWAVSSWMVAGGAGTGCQGLHPSFSVALGGEADKPYPLTLPSSLLQPTRRVRFDCKLTISPS